MIRFCMYIAEANSFYEKIVFEKLEKEAEIGGRDNINYLFFKNGPSSASFSVIFGPFQTNNTNFKTN